MPADVIATDIPHFFNTGEFGSVAVLNGGQSINVIFSDRTFEVSEGERVIDTDPFEAMTPSYNGVSVNDTLTIDSQDYRVVRQVSELDIDRLTLQRL